MSDFNNQKEKYAYALIPRNNVDVDTYFERFPDSRKSEYVTKCCDDPDCKCGCNDWWLYESCDHDSNVEHCHTDADSEKDECCDDDTSTSELEIVSCCNDPDCDCGCNGILEVQIPFE